MSRRAQPTGAGIVKKKPVAGLKEQKAPIYERIRQILESARTSVARSVNTTQVIANWLIAREIVEEEQKGQRRADYGKQLVEDLAAQLQRDFGTGYSALNLWLFRRFYLEYPAFVSREILYALRKESWKPGQLHPNLSWDKNEAVVRYTLGPHQEKKIFASRYKLHLPTEAELKTEIRRELEILRGGGINH